MEPSSTLNEDSLPVSNSILNLDGLTSDWTSDILTLFCVEYIPWFLWLTLKCNPSDSTSIELIWTSPPLTNPSSVLIPELFV